MSLTTAFQWIEQNPHKQHHLQSSAMNTNDDAEPLVWEQFRKVLLDLPGCLSCLLSLTDPMYRVSSINSKKQILRETILQLEERIHTELVGRKWSRRKLVELVSAQLAEKTPTTDNALEEALCELYQVQKVMIDHREKAIRFFPTDLRVWKSGIPVIISDAENLWIYEPLGEKILLGDPLVKWLQEKEENGWKVGWPVAEGRFEELKAALELRGLHAHAKIPGEKVKKEDYARTLGRAEAFSALLKLKTTSDIL